MVVSMHQLHYLPWIRYFHKIASADVFVVLDDIQFNKNGWQNRNKIKNSKGWIYLTVPVISKFQQRLDEVNINNNINWRNKHWQSLLINYSKAEYFSKYKDFFEKLYSTEWKNLNEVNFETLSYLINILGIKTKVVRSSEFNINSEATQRLVDICKILGADTYLSGEYALGVYLDTELFKQSNIKLLIQKWHCPEYKQQYSNVGFIPDLSIVDLLFNHGQDSLKIILEGGKIDSSL